MNSLAERLARLGLFRCRLARRNPLFRLPLSLRCLMVISVSPTVIQQHTKSNECQTVFWSYYSCLRLNVSQRSTRLTDSVLLFKWSFEVETTEACVMHMRSTISHNFNIRWTNTILYYLFNCLWCSNLNWTSITSGVARACMTTTIFNKAFFMVQFDDAKTP